MFMSRRMHGGIMKNTPSPPQPPRELLVPLLIATVAAVGLWPGAAHARCKALDHTPVPAARARNVPTNVKPFLAVFGFNLAPVPAILDGSKLVARGHRVALGARELPSSKQSYRHKYFVLEPQEALKPRRTYRLVPNVRAARAMSPKDASMARRLAKQLSAYRFTTGKEPDVEPPGRPARPTGAAYSLRELGCGPAEQITFDLAGLADDATPAAQLRLRLDVVEAGGKGAGASRGERRFSLFVPPPHTPGKGVLGHGMCSGNYKLRRGARYTIKVTAIDYAGNVGPVSEPIQVRAGK
jgi:hypothetical protein